MRIEKTKSYPRGNRPTKSMIVEYFTDSAPNGMDDSRKVAEYILHTCPYATAAIIAEKEFTMMDASFKAIPLTEEEAILGWKELSELEVGEHISVEFNHVIWRKK